MEIQEHSTGTVIVFELRGRLTLESFGLLKDRVRARVDQGSRRLVLDLSGVSYVDSIGVSELVRSHVIVGNHGGHLALAATPAQIDRLLRLTQLDQIFARFDTPVHAVESLERTDVYLSDAQPGPDANRPHP